MEARVNNLAERIAALEEQAKQGAADRREMKVTLEAVDEHLTSISTKISKWEGKFGGVIFAVGCLWAFFSGFAGAVSDWIKTFGGFGK